MKRTLSIFPMKTTISYKKFKRKFTFNTIDKRYIKQDFANSVTSLPSLPPKPSHLQPQNRPQYHQQQQQQQYPYGNLSAKQLNKHKQMFENSVPETNKKIILGILPQLENYLLYQIMRNSSRKIHFLIHVMLVVIMMMWIYLLHHLIQIHLEMMKYLMMILIQI